MNTYKVVIIGDAGVGKSSIQTRFVNQTFSNSYELTIGVEFASKEMTIETDKIKLHLWDTAGQETFKSICRSYYRGADSAIIVYDVSSPKSFNSVINWLRDIMRLNDNVKIYIVGNKSDMQNKIPPNDLYHFLEQYPNIKHFYTSAKDGSNIDNLFHTIAKNSIAHLPKFSSNQNINVNQKATNHVCCG